LVKVDVVLTCDRTLMSNYRNNEFLGFSTCAPPNFIPDSLYSLLFFPSIRNISGYPQAVPYGLRKIEAQLLKESFKVATVSPQQLGKHISEAKVLGIYTMDPFGLGPASTTLSSIFKKEPFLAKYFETLVKDVNIRKAKKNGLKVFVGGPGAWQFNYRPQFARENGIDCIIDGESENAVGKLFRNAINGQPVPSHYEPMPDEVPTLEEIPDITKPSINGLVEIGRGCCRHCEFCNVTLRPLRWYPYEKILREIKVNQKSGITMLCLHAEDVMLYGSTNTWPNETRLLDLHKLVVKKTDGLSWSHCSLAAVALNPRLFHKIAETIHEVQSWWGAEVGIETGSPEIAKKIMPGKAHPFRAENWPNVVKEGMGIMHDDRLVPACTLIVGLPEEKEEDIIKTMELVDDLKQVRSLIVPLFFVPLGQLTKKDWFNETGMTKLHRQLLFQCVEHDFRWVDNLLDWAYQGKWYLRLLKPLYKGFAGLARSRVRRLEARPDVYIN
jgi:radical SAM superfamily enzyme YgiQ (UPF0313 family)